MGARPSARLTFLLRCAALPGVAVLGAVAAVCIPAARADVLPTLPTVTLPVTVPALPIGTTGTTTSPGISTAASTTSTSSDNNGGAAASTTSKTVPDANTGVAGAIRLLSGAISIPISSVTAPVQLAINRITTSPSWIGAPGQRVRIVVRVTDSRGYRVRGATVDVRSTPARMVKATAARTTSTDGTASLQLSTTSRVPMRSGATLTLLVRAYQAGPAVTSGNVARRVVSVPVRPR